jgi:hypothetical protein
LAALNTGCPGDFDDSGTVTVDELILGLGVSLGSSELANCPAFDLDRSGGVSIDELIAGVQSAVDGCP